MALAYIYVIARRLLGILLGRLRSQHAKDIEIALSSPVERCRQQVRTRRCHSRRRRPPARAARWAGSRVLPGRGMTSGLLNPAGSPRHLNLKHSMDGNRGFGTPGPLARAERCHDVVSDPLWQGGDGSGTLKAIPAVAMAKRRPLSPLLR